MSRPPALSRGLMLVGMAVTGMALLFGLFGASHPFVLARLGGPIRAELALLAGGVGLFLLGQAIGKSR